MNALLSTTQASNEKCRESHQCQWGWHIQPTCVCGRWVMWSAWFASLRSYASPGIAAGSCASILHVNTFRIGSQALFYIFEETNKQKNPAFFHWGPPLRDHWIMYPFFWIIVYKMTKFLQTTRNTTIWFCLCCGDLWLQTTEHVTGVLIIVT